MAIKPVPTNCCMRIPPLLFLGLFFVLFCHSQTSLYITGPSSISIQANTTVAIDGLALTPSTLYTISGTNSLKRNATLAHPSIALSVNRSYQWNTAPTAFTGNIGFYYDEAELNGLTESDLTLNVHDGNQWLAFNSAIIRNTVTNFISTPVNNILMNEISLGAGAFPLPLKWGPVSATREKELALIKWETYNEAQVNFFTVERSTDGWHWITIGVPISAANTSGQNQYSFQDITLSNSKSYYRIKQVDHNLQYSYSPVVQVAAVLLPFDISIYPNPATHLLFVQSKDKLIKTIRVYKANGQLLKTVKVISIKHALPLETLSNGVYTLKVLYIDNTMASASFIKN